MVFLQTLFRFLSSLKLAVLVIVGLVGALTAATILEAEYDTPTAQYFVYRSFWFYGLLFLLGVNIFCVAMSRIPWKPRHTPFLLAHLGILILLTGSWITDRSGLDGSIRFSEGESTSVVELPNNLLVFVEGDRARTLHVPWIPPSVEFKPISARDRGIPYDVVVDQYITHADPVINFVPSGQGGADMMKASPALKLRLAGGPNSMMRVSQEIWLWAGDESASTQHMGPATFSIVTGWRKEEGQGPVLQFLPEKGGLSFRAVSSQGKALQGFVPAGRMKDHVIEPQWKGGFTATVLEWIPNAVPHTTYRPARLQYGGNAPLSAIHLKATHGGSATETWLGLGERAMLHLGNEAVQLGYMPQRVILPFSVKLERFDVKHYSGTRDPAEYSSLVSLPGEPNPGPRLISMNEPLEHRGFTFYQASYEPGEPRPVTSILSVNKDPGRWWKYIGSLLIVLGSILLFAMKYRKRKAEVARA